MKSLEDYHKDKRTKDNLYKWCKECKKEYDKKYRKTDKVKNLYKSISYRNRKREYKKFRSESDPRLQMFISAKSRAKQNNLAFNIQLEDIIIPEYCPLLDIRLERKPYGQGGSFQANSPSLDKIIPELGYIKNNIMVISMKANAMKYNATIEELKTFSNNILKIFTDD